MAGGRRRAALAAQALDGSLPVTISRRYPLADGVQACIDLLRKHTRGKHVQRACRAVFGISPDAATRRSVHARAP